MESRDLLSSPKRKRREASPARPCLDTALASRSRPLGRVASEMAEHQGSESPRTAVASKFKELGIVNSLPWSVSDKTNDSCPGSQDTQSDGALEDVDMDDGDAESIHKRLKLEQQAAVDARMVHMDTVASIESGAPVATAQAPRKASSAPKLAPTKATSRSKGPKTASPKKPAKRVKSPPAPMSSAVSDLGSNSSTSPSPTVNEPNPFTWQDWEITGHLALDADDDKTGINGIGFRPTPQTAEARSQKRRKQVAEWKSREEREQRQRRSERRYGSSREGAANGDAPQRMVRFA